VIELIDLKEIRRDCSHLSDLQALLKQLVGQPFQFFRVSYGDELRLHLGDLRSHSNPKLRSRTKGSYIIGARASAWIVFSAPRQVLATSGDARDHGSDAPATAGLVDIKTIETGGLITPGAIITYAGADQSAPGFSLRLRFSDGSSAFIRPAPEPDEVEPIGEKTSADDGTIEIPDWEVLTPHERILRVGPGPRWDYLDSTRKRSE
jgi:hypothetical protein